MGKAPNEHPWQSQKHCARLPIRSQGLSGPGRGLRGKPCVLSRRETPWEAPDFSPGSRHGENMQHRIPVETLGKEGEAMAHAIEACVHGGVCLPTC
ncbi:hypothetical protein CEJ62_19760, partial [Acinetobacter baumannii]